MKPKKKPEVKKAPKKRQPGITRLELMIALGEGGVYYDHLGRDKEGRWVLKHAFFYTHGNSSQQIAEKIKKVLPKAIIEDTHDWWRNWPATSYFVVKFRI